VAPRWAAFLGLTGLVVTLLLALARLSQDVLRGRRAPAPEVDPAPDGDSAGTATPDLSTGALLANVALTQGLFAVVLLAGAWYFRIPARAFGVTAAGGSTGPPAIAAGVALGVGLWVANEASAGLLEAAGWGYDEGLRELLAPDSAGGWVVLLVVVLPMVAGAEELVFRGAVVGVPAAGFGTSPWALAVVSALAFALGHGAQGRAGVVVTGLLGLGLAAGFVLTGSLLAVVLAHYLVNALEFVVHEGLAPDHCVG